jgi:predicted nucleotidyltransferase component of viral defense system
MPQYNRRELDARARECGFNRDTFEKVLRLKTILDFLNTQEYMREHLLLKGGTAINLTVFNLPRLSVDIDLDFIPNLTREEMVNERERLTEILKKYMSEQGYFLSDSSRFSHSLDAFHYNYVNAAGNKDMIKIEINYSLRTHVLPAEDRVFVTDAFGNPITVRAVAAMEIFAAKTNALLSRAAARDLYDFCNMVDMKLFLGEEDLFRKCIIFYATISAKEVNRDFDTSAIDSLPFSKIKSDLFPVLAVKDKFDLDGKKQQAKEYIASLMRPTEAEMEYMERFIAKEYKPELLFEDDEITERIRNHPMALWKCK